MIKKNSWLFMAVIMFFLSSCGSSEENEETSQEKTTESKALLSVGKQCFRFKNETTEDNIKIVYNENGTVSGTVEGWVEDHEQAYFTSWTSSFLGKLEGDTVKVTVKTEIEYDVQTEEQNWAISEQGIEYRGKLYEPIDCAALGGETGMLPPTSPAEQIIGVYTLEASYGAWIFAFYQKEGMYYAHLKEYTDGKLPAKEHVDIINLPYLNDFYFKEADLSFKGPDGLTGYFDTERNPIEALLGSEEGGDPLILIYNADYSKLLERIKM